MAYMYFVYEHFISVYYTGLNVIYRQSPLYEGLSAQEILFCVNPIVLGIYNASQRFGEVRRPVQVSSTPAGQRSTVPGHKNINLLVNQELELRRFNEKILSLLD